MKKLLSIHVRGTEKAYTFVFSGDPKYIEEWRADGLIVYEVCNIIPVWVVDLGLTRIWCRLQDLFNFKNPFAGEKK